MVWRWVIFSEQEQVQVFLAQVFITAVVSHMKIAKVQEGTFQNVRIALQIAYQFAIFISVCNFHISLQFSLFGV